MENKCIHIYLAIAIKQQAVSELFFVCVCVCVCETLWAQILGMPLGSSSNE